MKNIPQEYLNLGNDFGFTSVDEDEITDPIVQEVKSSVSETERKKLLEVEKLMMPLLVNLLKTADKDYIHWPNRKDKVQAQIDRLLSITRG